MLKNEQQLAGARKKLEALQAARVAEVDPEAVLALSELIEDVQRGIADYVTARDRVVEKFRVDSLDDLGPAVIHARLAAGLTQKELSDRLGVSEQQVSKDESREYQAAGVAKVAEVLDVLGYELVGEVRPSRQQVLPQAPEPAPSSSATVSWRPVVLPNPWMISGVGGDPFIRAVSQGV